MKIINKKAFTLVELIITIAVIAILTATLFVASRPQKRIGETNDAKRKNDAQAIEQAIKVLATDNGVVPSELKDLTENQKFAIVKAGGTVTGTYSCTALGTSIDKKDISSTLLSVISAMPMDPELTSSSNETGYYIVRRGSFYDVEPCNTYRLAATSGSQQMCGDGYCGTTESCSSCPADCGVCPQQAYTAGPNFPGTGANANDNGGAYAWTSASNILTDNGSYALYQLLGDQVAMFDNTAKLIKADGTYATENKVLAGDWAASWIVYDYGGDGSLWGETWAPADINDSDFGFALSGCMFGYDCSQTLKATNFGFNIPTSATITGIKVQAEKYGYVKSSPASSAGRVDYIKITVYYTN